MKKREPRKTPWRDNVESLAVAVLMVTMFQHFVIQTYRIPSGSMQPTLMGNPETGIHDRILVDKLSFHYRDPERFEVVVFRYPIDRSKFFVKRIVGMPDEELKIEHGDLFVRKDDAEAWSIVRRPDGVMADIWKPLIRESGPVPWDGDGAIGRIERTHHSLDVQGTSRLRFKVDGSVRDGYLDGYPAGMAKAMRMHPSSNRNEVGDLRFRGRLRPDAGCEQIVFELREGDRVYRFELDVGGDARIVAQLGSIGGATAEDRTVAAAGSGPRAGAWTSFAVQNLDDELALFLDGELVASIGVPPAINQRSGVALEMRGTHAAFDELQVDRDIYYVPGRVSQFTIPEGSYVMLGDNTQDSSDGREWRALRATWPELGGAAVTGNDRKPENPTTVSLDQDRTVFFRDEWGELHVVPERDYEEDLPEPAPWVGRDLIAGRALAVFWPFSIKYGVFRPKWIR